jgi:hypothetical protein
MAYTLKLHSSPKGKEEIDALTGARRDQFIAAAKAEMEGAPCKVPSDYFKYLAKENDSQVADQYAELWTAVKEGKDKPLYELWYFPETENGLVFEAGTARKAGVEIVDGSFEAADSASKKAEKLAEELQDSFDDRDVEGDDDEDEDEDEDEDDDEDEDEDEDEDDEDEDEEEEDD